VKPRVIVYMVILTATGGGQHAMSLLAQDLSARGYEVVFFTRPPVDMGHRYVTWLSRANVPIRVLRRFQESRLAALGSIAAGLLLTVPYALLRRRALAESRVAVRSMFLVRVARFEAAYIRRQFSKCADEGRRQGREVILQVLGPALLTPLLLDWAEEEGVASIYHEMGEADPQYVKTWLLEETVASINRANRAIAASPIVARNVREVYKYEGPIDAIQFMVDGPGDEWVNGRKIGGRITFGAIGRLVPHKRHTDLVHAIKRLADDGYDAGLVIASDGPMRGPLEALAVELGVDDRVTFLGEFEDLQAVMRQFDVFVLTSSSESQCMPITESMSYGKPVIVSRFGGIPDFVDDGVTGILVDIGDLDQLAAAMKRMIDAPTLREEMGRKGRERFLALFAPEKITDTMERIYADLSKERR
jgi:glycosyltransferase involved in cell wall biosynthesis